ncbi:hypothetical protein [Actinomadura chibensis]|uniref:Uncharacterized protein n=1 Tax=Actinomadura chibensis TaxID=392828 RepID=A0A5D0NUE6_9ACTN|nr:hypothetical protein [Actinomadura chibensis]TYB48007.1 hypothetical protein FXF69_01860 [Actinomadura chibensis]
MSDQGLLRLGARMAEVEGAYVRVLRAPGPREEERGLAELAEAAALLAAAARSVAGARPRVGEHRHRAATAAPERTRLRRRIVRVRRTTEWIIARAGGPRG